MDEVLTTLGSLLGPPTEVVLEESAFGEGLGFGYFRGVTWRGAPVSLYIEFFDWESDLDALDAPVFKYWSVTSGETPLRTIDDVGPGTLWGEAAEIYGSRIDGPVPPPCPDYGDTWTFVIDGSAATSLTDALRGTVDGDPSDPRSAISSMAAGVQGFSPGGC